MDNYNRDSYYHCNNKEMNGCTRPHGCENNYYNSCCDRCQTGPRGRKGAKGETSTANSIYIAKDEIPDIDSQGIIPLTKLIEKDGTSLTHDGQGVKIKEVGYYLVIAKAVIVDQITDTSAIALSLNGSTVENSSSRGSVVFSTLPPEGTELISHAIVRVTSPQSTLYLINDSEQVGSFQNSTMTVVKLS